MSEDLTLLQELCIQAANIRIVHARLHISSVAIFGTFRAPWPWLPRNLHNHLLNHLDKLISVDLSMNLTHDTDEVPWIVNERGSLFKLMVLLDVRTASLYKLFLQE